MLSLLSDVFRPAWPGSGLRGSIRAQARHELREHLKTNPVLRKTRLRPYVRPLAALLDGKRLSWFLWRYAIAAILAFAAELWTARFLPQALPHWSEPDANLWGFVKDADSYFLATQATLIGLIFPIAVGMVTLIVQRQQASTTSAHTKVRSTTYTSISAGLISTSKAAAC